MDETTRRSNFVPESLHPVIEQMLQQTKKQLIWTRICAVVCTIICLFLIIAFISIAVFADRLSDDLVGISSQLTETNWTELVRNIDEMAVTARESLGQTAAAVEELDIETLNEAIADLKKVIEPLANLMDSIS